MLEITKENIEAHQERHDLRLPETIKNSMRLVKRLNGRYLWVDRLCIIQNSVEHKGQQIGMMGSIYAHAYCRHEFSRAGVYDLDPVAVEVRFPIPYISGLGSLDRGFECGLNRTEELGKTVVGVKESFDASGPDLVKFGR